MKIVKYIIAIALCLVSASYGQRQTVMTDTNGNVVFPTNFWDQAPVLTNISGAVTTDTNGVITLPTNFWTANSGTNFQQYLGIPVPSSAAQSNAYLSIQHRVEEVQSALLGIEFPHAMLTVDGKIYVGRRGVTGSGNGEILVFNDPLNNLTNKTAITLTNSGGIPEMAYSTNTGLIYVATVSNGIYTLNPTNNATTLFSPEPMSFVGTVGVSSSNLWWADGRVLKKISFDNGSVIQSYTNTNVTVSAGGLVAGFHSIFTTPNDLKIIIGGTSTGSTTNNPATISVFNIASNDFTSTTAIPNQYVLTDDLYATDTEAFLGFELNTDKPLLFNIDAQSFTELGPVGIGRSYFVSGNNNKVYFGAINKHILEYNTATSNTIVYATEIDRNNGFNELVFLNNRAFGTTFESSTNAIVAEIKFTEKVSNKTINVEEVSGAQPIYTVYTNVLTSNITAPSGKAVWLDYVADGTNRSVDATGRFSGDSGQIGDVFVVRNRGTNNNLEVRRTGTLVNEGTIRPNQQRAWVYTGTGSGESRWKLIQGLSPLGLSVGLTTNITFVDLSTNTNSVTISNGIITGWTQ